jgi:hypothetical protein
MFNVNMPIEVAEIILLGLKKLPYEMSAHIIRDWEKAIQQAKEKQEEQKPPASAEAP